jgi:hypothetical protein
MNRNSVTATEMGQSYRFETDSDADDTNDIENEDDSEIEYDMKETGNQDDSTTATAATSGNAATSSGLTSSAHKRPHDETDTKVILHYMYVLHQILCSYQFCLMVK